MRILVSGASGLIGRALLPVLTAHGHDVLRLVRREATQSREIAWDPTTGAIDTTRLEDLDGVVHLAGENIAAGRWTARAKKRIRDSRVNGTRTLCAALASLNRKPQVLVCGSAIGVYGNRGDEELTEASSPGHGFLPDVCVDWESACDAARAAGIRVVNLRTGVVLTREGGALASMLLPFRCGVGGDVGSGRQYWSWISLDDEVGAIHHALTHSEVVGPVNATAPRPVTNHEFTKALGAVLHRPTMLPMPAFAARLLLGQMADELLLASARVLPRQLLQSGYQFAYPGLPEALRDALQ